MLLLDWTRLHATSIVPNANCNDLVNFYCPLSLFNDLLAAKSMKTYPRQAPFRKQLNGMLHFGGNMYLPAALTFRRRIPLRKVSYQAVFHIFRLANDGLFSTLLPLRPLQMPNRPSDYGFSNRMIRSSLEKCWKNWQLDNFFRVAAPTTFFLQLKLSRTIARGRSSNTHGFQTKFESP